MSVNQLEAQLAQDKGDAGLRDALGQPADDQKFGDLALTLSGARGMTPPRLLPVLGRAASNTHLGPADSPKKSG